jgi:hypothetical protein
MGMHYWEKLADCKSLEPAPDRHGLCGGDGGSAPLTALPDIPSSSGNLQGNCNFSAAYKAFPRAKLRDFRQF